MDISTPRPPDINVAKPLQELSLSGRIKSNPQRAEDLHSVETTLTSGNQGGTEDFFFFFLNQGFDFFLSIYVVGCVTS